MGAIVVLCVAALLSSLSYAQPRIGLLWLRSDITAQNLSAFRDRLREHSFVEGRNVHFEPRHDVPRYDALVAAAEELVRLRVDVIFAWGDTATQAAGKATSVIPIVTVGGADPVLTGLAHSLARPGKNVTGYTSFGQDLVAKRLELLKEAFPAAKSVTVLMNPGSAGQPESFKRAHTAAQALGLTAHLAEVRVPQDIETVLAAAARDRVDAITALPSIMLSANRALVVEATLAHKLPAMFPDPRYVELGGLMSYSADPRVSFRIAADLVARILQGAKPAEMPFIRPTRFYLTINLRAAKLLGVTIPPALVLRADQVIE